MEKNLISYKIQLTDIFKFLDINDYLKNWSVSYYGKIIALRSWPLKLENPVLKTIALLD